MDRYAISTRVANAAKTWGNEEHWPFFPAFFPLSSAWGFFRAPCLYILGYDSVSIYNNHIISIPSLRFQSLLKSTRLDFDSTYLHLAAVDNDKWRDSVTGISYCAKKMNGFSIINIVVLASSTIQIEAGREYPDALSLTVSLELRFYLAPNCWMLLVRDGYQRWIRAEYHGLVPLYVEKAGAGN